jgi:cytochrome c oxidase assembly protein subunit 15
MVTSLDVGMAVPDWPTTFDQNMFTYPWLNAPMGVMVEHGHRLLGSAVGILSILLVVGAFVLKTPRHLKALAIAALLAVIVQGVMGGLRVRLNASYGRELAMLHGVFGPATFGLMVAICVVTSRRWAQQEKINHPDARTVRRSTAALAVLLYVQLVLGAHVRQFGSGFVVHLVGAGLWTVFIVALHEESRKLFLTLVAMLTGVFVMQLFLGIGAMLVTGLLPPGFGAPPKGTEALIATGHQATGSLLLGLAVILALRAHRHLLVASGERSAVADSKMLGAVV